jgi:hypothetical protein
MAQFENIKLTGFDKDGTHRAGDPQATELWNVWLTLSAAPPREWIEIFDQEWRSRIYSMKQSATVAGSSIIIKCGLDDVENDHVPQLQEALKLANERYRDSLDRKEEQEARRSEQQDKDAAELDDLERRLKFE